MPRGRLLAVVPTYNEAGTVMAVLEGILSRPGAWEALVVDDASPDGTAGAVLRVRRRHPGRVHLLRRPAKAGLGSAYRDGLRWGLERGYRFLAQMDADLSHDPADLPRLAAALRDADVAVGSRYLGGKVSVVHWPLGRLALSMAANAYVRAVTGLALSDCTSGFKVWRWEALAAVGLAGVRSEGYSFQVELGLLAQRSGFRLVEVPIVFTDRRDGSSKLDSAVVWEAVWRVWTMRLSGATFPQRRRD